MSNKRVDDDVTTIGYLSRTIAVAVLMAICLMNDYEMLKETTELTPRQMIDFVLVYGLLAYLLTTSAMGMRR